MTHLPDLTLEWTLGLCASRGSRTVDVGAGGHAAALVVADGLGGHCTGWLGARLAVRVVLERLAPAGVRPALVGAAGEVPDDWGWAGATQSRRAGERLYAECLAAAGDLSALPPDLGALFSAIDRALGRIPEYAQIHGTLVGCVAATLAGARVRGVHVGVGRVLLLRAGAHALESLVVEHYWHLIADRLPPPAGAEVPADIIVNGLGGLEACRVGVDAFAVELAAGDLLLLCSRRMDLDDDDVVRSARGALSERAPLGVLARRLEARAAAAFPPSERHRAGDVAFALAHCRPAHTGRTP